MNLVKVTTAFMILVIIVFGLATYTFSWRLQKFTTSKLLFLYAVLVNALFTIYYLQDIFNDYVKNEFDLKNAVKLSSYMNIIASIICFIHDLILTNSSLEFLNNVPLFETIAFFDFPKQIISSAIIQASIKTVIFPIIIELTLVMRQQRNEPESSIFYTLYALFPYVVSNILPNCFFCSQIILKHLISILNFNLTEIIEEVNCMQLELQMKLQKPFYRMQRFCDLADKIDVLAEKYALICKQTDKYIYLVSLPFICSLLCNLLSITSGLFTQYHAIADTLINDEPYDVFNVVTNVVFLIIAMSEVIMQASICNDSLSEVRNPYILICCVLNNMNSLTG